VASVLTTSLARIASRWSSRLQNNLNGPTGSRHPSKHASDLSRGPEQKFSPTTFQNGTRSPSLCFCVEYWPAYMGSDKRIGFFAKQIAETKNVSIVVYPPLRIVAGYVESEAARTLLKPHLEGTGIHGESTVHHVRLPRFLPLLWKKNETLAYALTLLACFLGSVRIFSKLSPDIVVLGHPSYLCGLVGMFQAKMRRRKLVLDYPDPWTELTLETMGWSQHGLRRVLLGKLETLVVKASEVVVCASGPIARLATSMRGRHDGVHVIPNGVDSTAFDPKRFNLNTTEKHAERTVVFVGRIEKWSGVESLVNAAEISVRSWPDIRFLLVGDGLERKKIESLVSGKGLNNTVQLAGFKAPEDIPKILVASDIAVLTIGNSRLSNMISPLKLFEYMAMAKPLVVTDTESVREIVKNGRTGILVDTEDSSKVSAAILTLLNNPSLAVEMGQRARESILPSHSWTTLADNFFQACTSMANRSADHPV